MKHPMEYTAAYRLWQAPFLRQKFLPILEHNDLSKINRVLDVGCGPGTNAALFESQEYLGIDINPRYIEFAKRKFKRPFSVADVTVDEIGGDRFDFVLLNSLLHHIDDAGVERVLAGCARTVSDEGAVHILDLILPAERSCARALALLDRGNFPRPLDAWRSLFSRHFDPLLFQPYDVSLFGIPLWKMVYFKGRAR